jgi:xanthine dehydrogenase small subunit
MPHRPHIQFLLNGTTTRLSKVGADDMLLDYLRDTRRLTGSKEGCAEGDCGACTVLVGRLYQGVLRYETVNTCIRLLASLDGCHVVTIEHLSGKGGRLHPVQQAMVDFHGSQCGFCTPGFVMSLYALWMQVPQPTETQVETALQGNLCRCTGYEPIIRAALAMTRYGSASDDLLSTERAAITATLQQLHDGKRVQVDNAGSQAILPADVDDLAQTLLELPGATIVAGATDVGLWVTKMLRSISPAVHVGHLEGLKQITVTDQDVTLGAGVTYSECEQALGEAFPHLPEFWNRIAGWQVRNMGTVGGNIANGSPIGDTPPLLIALGAEITLRHGKNSRTIPLEDFFIAYGKQDRAQGEFVHSIRIPRGAPDTLNAAYKISKRRDEDISSVCAAFNVTLRDGKITAARVAFGGMAAIPKRAKAAEAVLTGQPFSEASLMAAAATLGQDFTPLSDWRASAEYRLKVSQNLFRRFYLEQNSSDSDQPQRLERV